MEGDRFVRAAQRFAALLAQERPALAEAAADMLDAMAALLRPSAASPPTDAPTPATESPITPPPTLGFSGAFAPTPARIAGPRLATGQPTLPITSALVPLRIGDASLHVAVSGTTAEIGQARQAAAADAGPEPLSAPRNDEPDMIRARCELKAASCEAFISRRAASGTPDEEHHVSIVRDTLQKAKAMPECFLWVFYPDRDQPDDATLRRIAANYRNLARAVSLAKMSEELGQRPLRQAALELLAQAQSALRVSLRDTWLYHSDHDQDAAFVYLNHATKRESFFIDRHMKLEDPADPLDFESLHSRLLETHSRFELAQEYDKETRRLLSKIKHHARMVTGNPDEVRGGDWEKIEQAAASLVGERLSASDPRLTDLLRPLREFVPRGIDLPTVVTILDRASTPEPADEPARAYSADVSRVRNALKGAAIAIVGGERRPEAETRIKEAFELSEVVWISLGEHASSAPAEAPIHRPEVRAVFVLIKLAGHQHVDDVCRFARQAGKPVVRVPAGYNPEQLAAQALEQAASWLDGAMTRAK